MEDLQDISDDGIEIDDSISENARLKDLNQQLQTQNEELKKQFEDALESFQRSEQINRENAKLKSQIFELKALNDELNQRLKICDDSKSELSSKIQEALADSEREHNDEMQQLQAKLVSIQNQTQISIDKMKLKMQSAEDQSMKAQTENAMIKNQLSKIVKLSENYFHKQFEDPKQLIEHLMHPQVETIEQTKQSAIDQSQDQKRLKQIKANLEKERQDRSN